MVEEASGLDFGLWSNYSGFTALLPGLRETMRAEWYARGRYEDLEQSHPKG
jgi:hypothetical protein